MAHTCPSCGYTCRCGGDIDDINFGENYNCICCDRDDDDWEDEEWGDEEEEDEII